MKISVVQSSSNVMVIKLEIQGGIGGTDILWKERMQEAIEEGRVKAQFNAYNNNNPALISY